MTKVKRKLPSLRRYLLLWFTGAAILTVFAYTQLLEYYLELGIDLRTQSFLERTATSYAQARSQAIRQNDTPPEPPRGPSLAGYLDLTEIPPQILSVFSLDKLQHGEVIRFTNVDLDPFHDNKTFTIETFDFCTEGTCDLIFLYPFELSQGNWLYLVHGLVGSEEDFEELEITDQFALAIGSLFVGLLLLVSFLLVRNIDRPLRQLNRWSASQNMESSGQAVPDLRFQELDDLAHRIQFAFQRMQEGVNKEKHFLRHASHELRTPIAILSSNIELLDKLTEKPDRSEAIQAAIVRQYRALADVQLLIETLLWINRQTETLPKSQKINLDEELKSIIDTYRYLLGARAVSLEIEGEGEVSGPAAAVRIVLSNLVRNAFQHTIEGDVRISISTGSICVENTNIAVATQTDLPSSGDDYGFGLGLELVSLICNRFNWQCTTAEIPHGRKTTVTF